MTVIRKHVDWSSKIGRGRPVLQVLCCTKKFDELFNGLTNKKRNLLVGETPVPRIQDLIIPNL